MMTTENFYLAVRLIAASYLLYRLWRWLFCGCAAKFWGKILPPKPQTEESVPEPINVIGSSKTVYLEEPSQSRNGTAIGREPEPGGYIGQEDEISPDDVETDYRPVAILPDEDLYDDDDGLPPDPDLSTGMSFERISEAVGVLTEPDCDEEKKLRAARTFDDLHDTQILEFITREVSNLPAIDKLIKEHLDANGEPRRPGMNLENFRIADYV